MVGSQLQLRGERQVFGRGHRVVAQLADGDDAVLDEIAGQLLQDGQTARVVGLFGVETEGAVVGDAVLRGAERLPAEQRVEVVVEAGG